MLYSANFSIGRMFNFLKTKAVCEKEDKFLTAFNAQSCLNFFLELFGFTLFGAEKNNKRNDIIYHMYVLENIFY